MEELTRASTAAGQSRVRFLDEADWAWRRRGPTLSAIRAFGLHAREVRPLPGGAGFVWSDGRVVVKPVGCVPEHDWVCGVFANWVSDAVRVPEPVRPKFNAESGWSVDGWGGHVFLAGRNAELLGELSAVKEASDAFHHSIKDLSRPEFMDNRDDPWAYGDRLAWESVEPDADEATSALIGSLTGARTPIEDRSQVIHGDILPNVLLADGLPPGVIDWPPYFRPVGMANAVAVIDAVTLRGGPLSLLDEWRTSADWDQLLIRALLYRLGPTGLFAARNRLMSSLVTHVQRARPVVEAVLSR